MRLENYLRRAAASYPDRVAVRDEYGESTYRELDDLADRYAASLRSSGVRAGDRVVLWAAKSRQLVAAMQAVLRLGACYVPFTITHPPDRVGRLADACAAAAIVTDADCAELSAAAPVIALTELDTSGPAVAVAADQGGGDAGEADDLAYILFTSGSTGEPKGVCISHGNATSFVEWAGDLVGIGADDRLANHASFTFDLSVFDLYAAFRAGASVTLLEETLSYLAGELVRRVREQQITVWYSVPSVLIMMMRDGGLLDGPAWETLRVCVVAGEAMPIADVRRFAGALPEVRFLNWYGPTETNVCTSHELTAADLDRTRPLPIGSAASGDAVTLDSTGILDPPGDEGEIVVSGPTVMRGYWGQPAHRGPYRTGDIGRRLPDGTIEYVGRLDDMVKIRGHRVEPGEIEVALRAHPQIGDVAVLAVGEGIAAALHAVVVPVSDRPVPRLLDVKRYSAERLPRYMIVDRLHVVKRLPLTQNGKVDRFALAKTIEEADRD